MKRRGSETAEALFALVMFAVGGLLGASLGSGPAYEKGVRDCAEGRAVLHDMPDGSKVVVKLKEVGK